MLGEHRFETRNNNNNFLTDVLKKTVDVLLHPKLCLIYLSLKNKTYYLLSVITNCWKIMKLNATINCMFKVFISLASFFYQYNIFVIAYLHEFGLKNTYSKLLDFLF